MGLTRLGTAGSLIAAWLEGRAMHVCLIGTGDAVAHPVTRALAASWERAGNRVTVVCGQGSETAPAGVRLVRVPGRRPLGLGRLGWLLRRIQPRRLREALVRRSLGRAAHATAADVFVPITEALMNVAVWVAKEIGSVVIPRPGWAVIDSVDAVTLAPGLSGFTESPAGGGLGFFSDSDSNESNHPEPGRHVGLSIALVYSGAETSPGAYLQTALERAGASVVALPRIDWGASAGADMVVVVESPYPAFEVVGENPGVPVLFWVHHGEHHLEANLRLVDRYGVDAVLLAHSWHLTPRFPVPVHRFPFAVDPDVFDAELRLADRALDVAMVAAGLDGEAPRYRRRREIVAAARSVMPPERVAFRSGITPREMATTYGNARIVLNDGGEHHFPITMRVFEAIGSGAVLLTDPLPGLDILFEPGEHYRIISDVTSQLPDMIDDVEYIQATADAARAHAMAHHTYDHRVDELVAIAGATEHGHREPTMSRSAIADVIDRDMDVHTVADFGASLREGLPSRAVEDRPDRLSVLRQRSVDAVVVAGNAGPSVATAARRYVYCDASGELADTIADVVGVGPESIDVIDGIARLDLGSPGYRADQIYGVDP